MKVKEIRPLKPFITLEQIERFKSEQPETYTGSHIINEICIARERLGVEALPRDYEHYLCIDQRSLTCTVKVITGYRMRDLLCELNRRRAIHIHAQNPEWSVDKVAQAAGFRDHSTLFRSIGRETYDSLFAKFTHRDF